VVVDDVVPLLLAACPTARPAWDEHLQRWGDQNRGNFNDVAVFAHHVVDALADGRAAELPAFFQALERLIREGDHQVVHLASVGLIEDIQNIASHQPFGYAAFEPWLGTETQREWRRIEALWEGKTSLAEVLRDESRADDDPDA
jgi:hypothetical protein